MDMIRRQFTLPSIFMAACALLVLGCEQQPATPVPPVAVRPTAKQSFEQIVRFVTDGLEMPGAGSMYVTQRDGTSSRFQVHNSVTSQITPPANANESYRGTITVTSRSVYSLRQAKEEEDEEEAPPEQSSFGMEDEIEEGGTGFQVMDQELITGSKKDDKTGAQEIERVQRHTDEEVRKFDFAYENERWVIKSKIDPKAEGQAAIVSAITRALQLQP
jgi:hypothetical protein